MKKLIAILCLFAICGYCDYTIQEVIKVECKDGNPDIILLSNFLKNGYTVVSSTPVLYIKYNKSFITGESKIIDNTNHTSYIIYILQKVVEEDLYRKHQRDILNKLEK